MQSLLSIFVGILFFKRAAHSLLFDGTVPARELSLAWLVSFSLGEENERNLRWTGDVWRACSGNKTEGKESVFQNHTEYSSSVYEYTTYDDGHEPVCTCFFDKETLEYWAQCAVGDKLCDEGTGACTRKHEFFLFSDASGDLKQKASCDICTDVSNCAGVEETCTLVVFQERRPVRCVLKGIQDDGRQIRCEECAVCQDDQSGEYGISKDCFGDSTPKGTCDTSGTAHLHNFEPVMKPGKDPMGGTFGKICQKDEEAALYANTEYDDKYNKICDCKDPTEGVITCDLFVNTSTFDCFANECTELSERFFFNSKGELNGKMTCDRTDDLCSIVYFSDSGVPDACSIFSPGNLNSCDTCSICKDENLQVHGIRYDCFGSSVNQDTCLSDKGRTVFNLQGQHGPQNLDQTKSTDTVDNDDPTKLILGITLGGIVVLAVSVAAGSRYTQTSPGEHLQETTTEVAKGMDDPPVVLVDQAGRPMVEDPSPIAIT